MQFKFKKFDFYKNQATLLKFFLKNTSTQKITKSIDIQRIKSQKSIDNLIQILTTTPIEKLCNKSKLNKNDNDNEHDASERERFKRSTKTDRSVSFPEENHPAVKDRTEEAALSWTTQVQQQRWWWT